MPKKVAMQPESDEELSEGSAEDSAEDVSGDDSEFDDLDDIPLEPVSAGEAPGKRKVFEDTADDTPQEKKLKSEYFKAPTAEELSTLKETENLFHSNIFRLQIEELLSEVRVKDKYKSPIQKWVNEFSSFLRGLPETESYKLDDLSYLTALGVKPPLDENRADKKTLFRFLPPSDVQIIGSHRLEATSKPIVTVDVGVKIPKDCFKIKDAQDCRYFRKRSLYLAFIAGHLKKSNLQCGLKYCTTDDPFLPILEVTPTGKLEKSVRFAIRPHGDGSYFQVSKFVPSANNIRSTWLGTENTDHLPTPRYNSSMLRDLLLEKTESERSEVFQQIPAMKDALLLLKVWLHQRKLDQGFGAFTPYLMSMYLVYLTQQKRVNTFMSSYQIIRNALMHIAKADLSESGITMCKSHGASGSAGIEEFRSNFEIVFVDESGCLNFAAHVSQLTWNRVQWEAAVSVKALDSFSGRKSFEALFMTPVSFLATMDQVIRISGENLESAFQSKYSQKTLQSSSLSLVDSGKLVSRTVSPILTAVLRRALEGRTRLITQEGKGFVRCEVDNSPKADSDNVALGFILDPERAWNPLIKGPEADQPEAAEFREFWGDKSQLRRFQDGTICEAVVFPAKTLDDKRLISKQIVRHILQRHLSIKSEVYIADQLEGILRQGRFEAYGTGEEANAAILKSLDGLGRELRGLEDLPLTVTSVQGVSAGFRYTDVYPTIPGLPQGDEKCLRKGGACMLPNYNRFLVPTWVEPLKVILTLETSNKWPDDLEALQRLKAALHLAIGRELSSRFDLVTLPSISHVDVLKDGFVFRFSVAYPREVVLAKTFKDTDGILRQRETDLSQRLEMETSLLPKITSALHGLQMQHPSYSGAARLVKRWVAGHMLSGHVPEIVTELLVASAYLDLPSFESSGPMSPQVGFLRFLQKISRTDWKLVPMILNFNDLLGAEQIAEYESVFSAQRETLPPLVIFTPYTKTPNAFTREGPSFPVLARLMMLASETLRVLEGSLNSSKVDEGTLKSVFRPSLSIYDVVIHLKPKMVARRYMNLDAKTGGKKVATLPTDQVKIIPVVGFEPVDFFLEELKDAYGDLAMFFYDRYGGMKIGIVWDKQEMQDVDFKVYGPWAFTYTYYYVHGQNIFGANPDHLTRFEPDDTYIGSREVPKGISNVKARTLTSSGKLTLNIDAIVQDISLIGKGLVDRVELNTERWIVPPS